MSTAGSTVNRARIERQRVDSCASRSTSSRSGSSVSTSRCISLAITAMVESGVPSSSAAAAAQTAQPLLLRQRALGRGERVAHLALLLGEPPAVERDQQYREAEPGPRAS